MNYRLRDMAILYRSNAQSRVIEEALNAIWYSLSCLWRLALF